MKHSNMNGTVFVFGGYRIKVSLKNKSLLLKHLTDESKSHGEYLLLTNKSSDSCMAVFGNAAGISAGEYVRSKLKEVYEDDFSNVIYVESLSNDRDKFAVVILINGLVELDLILNQPYDTSEIDLVLDSVENIDLIISDDDRIEFSAISQTEKIGRTIDDCPAFFEEKVVGRYDQFRSLGEALKLAKIKKSNHLVLMLTVVLIAISIGYYFYQKEVERKKQQQVTISVDPFYNYKTETNGLPSPNLVVYKSLELLNDALNVDGWIFSSITVNRDTTFSVVFSGLGGDTKGLKSKLNKYSNLTSEINGSEIKVAGNLTLFAREFPYAIYSIPSVEDKLFKNWVVDGEYKMSLVNDIDKGAYLTRQYELTVSNAGLVDFVNISSTLVDMPVVVNQVVIKPNEGGFDLVVSLIIFGSRG